MLTYGVWLGWVAGPDQPKIPTYRARPEKTRLIAGSAWRKAKYLSDAAFEGAI